MVGKIGPKAKGAVRQLIVTLNDKDAKVCVNAAVALGAIGPGAKAALEALKTASEEGSPELKAAATEAIKKIAG